MLYQSIFFYANIVRRIYCSISFTTYLYLRSFSVVDAFLTHIIWREYVQSNCRTTVIALLRAPCTVHLRYLEKTARAINIHKLRQWIKRKRLYLHRICQNTSIFPVNPAYRIILKYSCVHLFGKIARLTQN